MALHQGDAGAQPGCNGSAHEAAGTSANDDQMVPVSRIWIDPSWWANLLDPALIVPIERLDRWICGYVERTRVRLRH
jgi:hypothetical protein